LRPYLGAGNIASYFKASFKIIISFLGIEALTIMPINKKSKNNLLFYPIGIILILGFLYICSVESALSVRSVDDIVHYKDTIIEIIKSVDIPFLEFFRRLDAVIFLAWIMAILGNITILAYAAVYLLASWIDKINFKLVAGVVFLISFIISIIPGDTQQVETILNYISYVGIFTALLIPLALLIITEVKNRGKNKKVFKYKLLQIVVPVLTILTFTSCWDYKDINNRTLPLSIGIDRIDDQVIYSGKIAAITGGAAGKTSEKAEITSSYDFRAKGKDFEAAREDYDIAIAYPDFSGAIQVILFSKNYAEVDGIESYIYRVNKLPEHRKTVLIAVSREPPDVILGTEIENDISPEFALENTIRYLHDNGIRELERMISAKVKREIVEIVSKSQDLYKCDIFQFARYFNADNPHVFKKISWVEEYPEAIVNIEVKTKNVSTNFLDLEAGEKH